MVFIGKMYGGDEKITQLRGRRVVFVSIGRTGKIGKMLKPNNRTITTTATAPARTRRTVVRGAVTAVAEPKFRETVGA